MNTDAFVYQLSLLKPSSTFLSLKGYRNSHSEIADYSLVFNMSYSNALKRSIETLKAMSLGNELERQAREELLASYTKSLANPEPIETREDAYMHFMRDDGSFVSGLKLHVASNTLHLYALQVHKKVLMQGMYPKVNSRPLTLAKKKLASLTSVGKFRQFRITPDQVDSIQVQGLSLLPPEE